MRSGIIAGALVIVAALAFTSQAADVRFDYERMGAGFEVSFVGIPDGPGVQDPHPTVGWAGLMDILFNLGTPGKFSIHPNIQMWFSTDDHPGYEFSVFQSAFNGDFRYYFPIPEHIRVRPFVGNGIGLIMNSEHWDYDDLRNDFRDTDVHAGFNFHGGADFQFSERILGFGELKGTFSRYDVFRMTYGMIFRF